MGSVLTAKTPGQLRSRYSGSPAIDTKRVKGNITERDLKAENLRMEILGFNFYHGNPIGMGMDIMKLWKEKEGTYMEVFDLIRIRVK